jgi:hypothetical protein
MFSSGCVIILIDQSANTGVKEAPGICMQANGLLSELASRCTKGGEIINRVWLGMYGYSGAGVNWAAPELSPNSEGLVSLSSLDEITMEIFYEEEEIYLPYVVSEQAFGDAPIVLALEKAREIAESFSLSHPDSFPPLVINITAGDFGNVVERDFLSACFDVTKVGPSDGAALMIHWKVNSQSKTTTLFPTSPEGLDASSNLMFQGSSMMPEVVEDLLRWNREFYGKSSPRLGSYPRLFAENARMEFLLDLLPTNPELPAFSGPDKGPKW